MKGNLKFYSGALLAMPILPFLFREARKIQAAVPVLPEAKGKFGTVRTGAARDFQLITVGESAMAGVGVNTHDEGFTGELARCLSRSLDVNVHWKVYARRGFAANRINTEVLPNITEDYADLIVIQIGANDAFEYRQPSKWRQDIIELIAWIRNRFGPVPIAFTNMPPLREFPVFKGALRFALGYVIDILSDELASVARSEVGVYYYSRNITLDDWMDRLKIRATKEEFFSDGVHPSGLTYKIWAQDCSEFIRREIPLKKHALYDQSR